MTSFQVSQWLREGIAAAKAGDAEKASELLRKVVDVDEYNEQAWLWLSSIVETDADREVCLENVLAINPENKLAKTGLVHLHNKRAQPAPLRQPEPEPPPPPEPGSVSFAVEESVEALQSDWWDQPQTIEPAAEPFLADAAPAFEATETEAERERVRARKRRRRTRSPVQRLVVPLLLVLGVLAAGVVVAAQRQIGPFDPSGRIYADAMRPLLAEYDAWWVGPQGALLSELNSLCGVGADGWRNQEVLSVCNGNPSMDCTLLAAHCGTDVEAMRERVDELSREVQETGEVLLAAFDVVPPPADIARDHSRFLACLQARIDAADRVAQLARGEMAAFSDYIPICQMFSFAEENIKVYVSSQ